MPGALHTELAQAAARERLSLNRFVTNVLAASVSPTAPAQPHTARRAPNEPTDQWRRVLREPSRALRIALATNLAVVVLAGAGAIVLLVLALQHGV
jgi:hypothetical protein